MSMKRSSRSIIPRIQQIARDSLSRHNNSIPRSSGAQLGDGVSGNDQRSEDSEQEEEGGEKVHRGLPET